MTEPLPDPQLPRPPDEPPDPLPPGPDDSEPMPPGQPPTADAGRPSQAIER